MNHRWSPSLGTRLRLLVAQLDGQLAWLYEREGHQFRPRYYPVFQLLLAHGQASVSDVAGYVQVTQPAATQTLTEMTKLGMVAAEAGADRRERIVRLTPQGRAMVQQLQPIWDAVARAAQELDEELTNPLSDTINEAIDALSRESFPARIARHRSPNGETE